MTTTPTPESIAEAFAATGHEGDCADRIRTYGDSRASEARREMMEITDAMVEAAHKAQMAELFRLCQPDNGEVFAFMDDRKDVVRIAITAGIRALSDKGGVL